MTYTETAVNRRSVLRSVSIAMAKSDFHLRDLSKLCLLERTQRMKVDQNENSSDNENVCDK